MKNIDEYMIKHEERKMQQDALVTLSKKNKFISDIKNGLGEEIIKEPNKPQKKITFWGKIKRLFSND
jgi:uncharacterized GH25 family protein